MIENNAKRGLIHDEPSIFERSEQGRLGYVLPPFDHTLSESIPFARVNPVELPEVSELEVVRHYTRLSSYNYSIDQGMLPLGSCTMKYNPRINEELAILPGITEVHPDLPEEYCQGALEIVYRLEQALCEISGLDAISTQPPAGAMGELTGLLVIKAFHEHSSSARKVVLVPDSAHGTNPASCTLVGYEVVSLKTGPQGFLLAETVKEAVGKYGRDIAALMLTNPNTCGVFESQIVEIAQTIHQIGAQLYMDGANMNAILGVAKPRDMGVDVMHFNLHKTFSTPHGGGGPGAGPIAVKEHLATFLPGPRIELYDGKFRLFTPTHSIGKVKGGFGNFGVLVRALSYILHYGSDGLHQVSKSAVLNANYIRKKLEKYFDSAYESSTFHECVLTDKRQLSDGVKTLQIAKALIDEGFHPPTVYFPLVVQGAMLIEPTETESLQDIEHFISAMTRIAQAIQRKEKFEDAPTKTFVGKVDEVGAARKPILSLDDRST